MSPNALSARDGGFAAAVAGHRPPMTSERPGDDDVIVEPASDEN